MAFVSSQENAMATWTTTFWKQVTDDSDRTSEFARHLREIARPAQIAFTKVMRFCQGNPVGIELKNPTADRWQVVLPEPVQEGGQPMWRVLSFDQHGFSGHDLHKSAILATEDAIQSGFTEPDHGALDRVTATSTWQRGMAMQELRDRHCRGELTYAAMIDLARQVA